MENKNNSQMDSEKEKCNCFDEELKQKPACPVHNKNLYEEGKKEGKRNTLSEPASNNETVFMKCESCEKDFDIETMVNAEQYFCQECYDVLSEYEEFRNGVQECEQCGLFNAHSKDCPTIAASNAEGRKSGYFRVKYHDEWLIKWYSKITKTWSLFGDDATDDVFEEIDENRIDPTPITRQTETAKINVVDICRGADGINDYHLSNGEYITCHVGELPHELQRINSRPSHTETLKEAVEALLEADAFIESLSTCVESQERFDKYRSAKKHIKSAISKLKAIIN